MDDALKYPYWWAKGSDISLSDFLAKYKPSLVQDDGTKPWIWIKASDRQHDENETTAIAEATKLLGEATEHIEKIKNDDSIPTRSNKKTGAKSKKELREQAHAEATEKLKEISIKHKYVCGKWLIFSPSDRVDKIWSTLATSLVSGPLSETQAYSAKVATCPKTEMPNYQHVICLYMPDVYDKDAVTEVMKVLLGKHGFTLSSVKSDLYTSIGLYSKHPSGIPSIVWKPTSLLDAFKIKELKDSYFALLNKTSTAPKATSAGDVQPKPTKPQLKKKAVADDPFASEEEDNQEHATTVAPSESKAKGKGKGKAKRVGESGNEEARPRKKSAKA